MAVDLLANVPWTEILKALPELADAATRLWKKTEAQSGAAPLRPEDDPKTQVRVLEARLASLEAAEAEQAKLIKDLLAQLQAMSAGLQQATTRAKHASIAATLALLLAAGSLGWVVFR